MIPNNANYHGLQHEPANRDDLREWRRMFEANKTGHKCEACGNDIRKSDDKATDRQCGFCATVHPAKGVYLCPRFILTPQAAETGETT